jgi:hypothetical protein
MLRRATSLNPVDAAPLSYGIRVWQAKVFFSAGDLCLNKDFFIKVQVGDEQQAIFILSKNRQEIGMPSGQLPS